MQIKVGNRSAAVTISAEIRKIVIQYRLALLLSMPKKEKFLFLTGLSCLLVNRIEKCPPLSKLFTSRLPLAPSYPPSAERLLRRGLRRHLIYNKNHNNI